MNFQSRICMMHLSLQLKELTILLYFTTSEECDLYTEIVSAFLTIFTCTEIFPCEGKVSWQS